MRIGFHFSLDGHPPLNVLARKGFGARLVPGFDGTEDFAVIPAGLLQVAGVRQGSVSHALDLVVDGLLNFLQPAVAGNERRGVVELIVQIFVADDVRLPAGDERLHLADDLFELFDAGRGQLVDREHRGQGVEGGLERVDLPDVPVAQLGHEHPAARLAPHQALGLQQLERLPHRRPADAEPVGDLLLLDLLAGPELAPDDHLFEALDGAVHNGFDFHDVCAVSCVSVEPVRG